MRVQRIDSELQPCLDHIGRGIPYNAKVIAYEDSLQGLGTWLDHGLREKQGTIGCRYSGVTSEFSTAIVV